MATMRLVQIAEPKGPFELVERKVPEPGAGSVRIKIQACGVCHSDFFTKEGTFPFIQFPRVPRHEVAGIIDAIGSDVAGWEALKSLNPMGVLSSVKDIVDALMYLIDARTVTGEILNVDGGAHMGCW